MLIAVEAVTQCLPPTRRWLHLVRNRLGLALGRGDTASLHGLCFGGRRNLGFGFGLLEVLRRSGERQGGNDWTTRFPLALRPWKSRPGVRLNEHKLGDASRPRGKPQFCVGRHS